MITIDGSMGEGGGQILRSSLALAIITGTAFQIENIRAKRDKPGLRRQHLTAVKAAAEISDAKLAGADVGSRELSFDPGPVKAGIYRFDVGSAGSTTLVLQTILPPLLLADAPSEVQLIGGTHNPGAPPFDFLQRAFLPVIDRMGPLVQVDLERPGFAPAGGGRWNVAIDPVRKLKPIELMERGAILHQRCQATIAALPRHIAERELASAAEVLDWPAECFEVEELPPEYGPGNIVKVSIDSEHISQVFTSFGQRGVRAERVGHDAAEQACRYLEADVPVGDCLADQLLLPMALAGVGRYKTLPPTRHAQTNMEVIRLFLGVQFSTTEVADGQWFVEVKQSE